jgi:hypothetical protein
LLRLIKFIIVLLILLLIAVASLFIASVEKQPLVTATGSEQINDADSVSVLLKQLGNSIQNRTRDQHIPLSENQLNSLVGFAQRANPKFRGQVNITRAASNFSASYQLPDNPLGAYVNFSALVMPGPGIHISEVRLGRIVLPGKPTVLTLTWLADWWTDSNIASQFVRQVQRIVMFDREMVISLRPLDQFLRDLNDLKKGISVDTDLSMRTAYYLKYIAELKAGDSNSPQSLSVFMGPLFAAAQSRSDEHSASLENEAAIMALAIYAGHHRFANFVGDVQPDAKNVAVPRRTPVLAQRSDLNQHFIFSAAIKILSKQGISAAIGEFKELMDRADGGSGYSFVDLAADHAGLQFAQIATSAATAQKVQRILAGQVDERLFFPSIAQLPENLDKASFVRRFNKVDSPQYQLLVDEIDRRISQLPIHQD